MSETEASEYRTGYHDLVRSDIIPYVPKGGGTMVDVGGGIGALVAYLKTRGCADRVGVIDMVKPSMTNPPLDFAYEGDLEDAPFIDRVIAEEGPFNTILLLDVLEHLVDPWRLVAQLHKSLTPGGLMIASIPNVRNYMAVFPLVFRNQWTLRDAGILDRTHLRFFVRSSAIELMTSSGLRLESVDASPTDGRKVALIRKLTFGLFNSFTDRQYIVRVRRAD